MTASPASDDEKVVLNNPKPVPRPGTWISAAIVTVLGAMLIHGLVTNEKFHWSTVWFFLREVHVVKAVGWTLLLTFMAMAIGIVLAVTTAIQRQSSNPVLRWVALAYLWFFRGTPIYTQLVFWGALSALYQKLSLGIPFGPELLTFKTTTVFTPFVAAVLGLGINEGAYLSEIVRSGLNSVDKGQSEAAGALGMSRGQILRRIILPQAMRVIVPPTGNETISMLKTTSLVLAVPFTLDLTFVTNSYASLTYQIIPLLIVAAIWYIIITSILMVGQHYIERYYGKGFDSDKASAASGRGLSARQQAILNAHTTKDDPFLEVTPSAHPLTPQVRRRRLRSATCTSSSASCTCCAVSTSSCPRDRSRSSSAPRVRESQRFCVASTSWSPSTPAGSRSTASSSGCARSSAVGAPSCTPCRTRPGLHNAPRSAWSSSASTSSPT